MYPAVQAFTTGAQMFLLTKAPCWNFPKRGENRASQREREGAGREKRKRLPENTVKMRNTP